MLVAEADPKAVFFALSWARSVARNLDVALV